MEPTLSSNQAVQLILHPDRETCFIGESIRPELQIQNHNDFPIEIQGFVFNWDKLAFSSPNAVHLIGSDGLDRFLPYQRSATFTNYGPPLKIGAKGEEWLYLPISNYLHLRQPGEYTFWVELQDNLGTLHSSNQISFRLIDVDYSISPDLTELTIESKKSSFRSKEAIDIEVIFTNKSNQPIIFLKPQQDSFDGWVNPIYQFTVLDSAGRSLALARRDGTMARPIYDETTRFTVAPSSSARQQLRLPVFPEMRSPGEYHVRLTYIVREKAVGKGGIVLDKPMNWEEGVFIGRIESNELAITIR